LLGPSGMGEEGQLKKYMMDWRSRQQFLLEAAHRCQEAGLYDKVSSNSRAHMGALPHKHPLSILRRMP
jgi:hypothetical protein